MKVIYNGKEITYATYNYNNLLNKPKINSVTLSGNISLNDINVYQKSDVDNIFSTALTSGSIKVLASLPASATKNTKYYIGPTSGKFHIYVTDDAGHTIDLGLSNQTEYTSVLGSGVNVDNNKKINAMYNNYSTFKNNENFLYIPNTEVGRYGKSKPDNETVKFDSNGKISVSELTGTKGTTSRWVYLSGNKKITPSSGYVGMNNKKPVYMNNGVLTEFTKTIFDLLYPVGSIYVSATMSNATQVMNAFGGTWVAWGAGRVPVSIDTSQTEFNTVEKTGGEKTHKLTIDEIPSHNHTIFVNEASISPSKVWPLYAVSKNYVERNTSYTGGDQPHNNLMPYITCYMYKRTA